MLLGCSGHEGGLVAASELLEVSELDGELPKGLDNLKRVLIKVAAGGLVLLQVQADGSPHDASARHTEHDARAISEDEADALVLGHAAIDGIVVLKHICLLELPGAEAVLRPLARHLSHACHHLVGTIKVHTLVVVPSVVVTAIGLPVILDDVGGGDEGLGGVRVLGSQDLEPCKHSPHAVLLADVVAASAEGLLAADEGRVLGGVHEVAEELPARGGLEEGDVLSLAHKIESA
mmetsp:Transcript_766/g.1818  ORF Transcript_766/g.1818 Transcript_766/m.1818 type:complete len:234 (-) Transcript_766:1310-2011(-)